MHFGKLLKALYEARGFTQITLAEASGLSATSIQRGIASEKCPWRRSAALDVFKVLHARAPMSDLDIASYFQLAGLETLAKQGREAMAHLKAEAAATAWKVSRSPVAFDLSDDPLASRAHSYVQILAEAGHASEVLHALKLTAAHLNVSLPPNPSGQWVLHSGPIDAGEGRTIEIHAPITPRSATKPKAQPNRRTGA
jgi:hypothetical protein